MPRLRIATRGSELALAQAEYVEERLRSAGYETEKVILKTTGDVNLAPFALASGDERKGLFTKEIEDALIARQAEIAVHSYKDLPSVSVPGLVIAAIPQRLDGRDYFLFLKSKRVQNEFPFVRSDAVIGTSSIRRRSQLSHRFSGLKVRELRGNVPTRVKRLFEADGPDGILLSGAGVERLMKGGRLGSDELLSKLEIIPLDIDQFVPAPAQGTLAVQCRGDDPVALNALSLIHDAELAKGLGVERGVLAALEGGCHLPLGAHAVRREKVWEARIYLGREFAKSRYGQSIQITRRHVDPVRLQSFLIRELTVREGGAPIFVFGRKSRVEELMRTHHVNGFGVLEQQVAIGGRQDEIADAIERSRFIALFSAEGVRTFARALPELFERAISREDLLWGVPGERTAALLREKGLPGGRLLIGEDGTGPGLARRYLDHTSKSREDIGAGGIVALSAEEGREEFDEVLVSAGLRCERFALYRTEKIDIPRSGIESIGEDAYLIFGSPSSFEAFASSLKRHSLSWRAGWRICSIGKTTSATIRELSKTDSDGIEPYFTADEPDYDAMIRVIKGGSTSV